MLEELIQHSPYPYLFKTKPDGLKYSVWRNISAHHSYTIDGESIICRYNTKSGIESLNLTRRDLISNVQQIVKTLEVLNLAHKFFGFDNFDGFTFASQDRDSVPPGRNEIWLLFFITGINSLGYSVLKFHFEQNGNAVMVVRDLTQENATERVIHSSQFIFPIWLWTKSRNISVDYILKNGKLYLRSSSTSDVCESIHNGDHGINYFYSSEQN